MSPETPSKPTKLCPTCGTRVSEDATRCLVCGSDLTTGERPSRPVEAVRGSRMPEVTMSLPMVLGLFTVFLAIGAGLVWYALKGTNPVGTAEAIAITETPTPTQSATPTPTLTEVTPTVTSTPQPSPTPFEYKVKLGETCYSIAYSFGVSINSIVLLNDLPADCSSLYEGQPLKIPQPTPTSTPMPTSTLSPGEATEAACPKVEVKVASGDTMSKIVANYDVPAEAIKEYNGLVSDVVQIGQTLIVPLCRRNATPGPTPTATPPPPYQAPNLLLPADGAPFQANDTVSLQWAAVGTLRENEAYAVTIEDVTEGQGRKKSVTVTDTKYIITSDFRPQDNTPHVIRWSVMPVRQVSTDEDGNPVWEAAGTASDWRDFIWTGSAQATSAP